MKRCVLGALLALGCGSSESDKGEPAPRDPQSDPRAAEWARWPMPNPAVAALPNPQRYAIDGGEVTDEVTGLVWQKEAEQGGRGFAFDEAPGLCAAHGGDWRLPTAIELVSLIDFTQPSPTIAPELGSPLQYFWTSTLLAGDASRAWTVYFGDGHSSDGTTAARDSVRCVREAPAPLPASRYEVVAGTIRDTLTGLLWRERASSRPLDFSAAAAECASLSFRVPSMKELQTLVDRTRVRPSIDASFFPETPSEAFWTSSLVADEPELGWSVSFELGRSDRSDVSSEFWVRCVR